MVKDNIQETCLRCIKVDVSHTNFHQSINRHGRQLQFFAEAVNHEANFWLTGKQADPLMLH